MKRIQLTKPRIWKPKEGDTIRGYVLGTEKIETLDAEFWRFEKENGEIILVPQYANLDVLGNVDETQLVEIVAGDLVKLKGGRSVRNFAVFALQDEGDESGELPF